MPETGAAVIGTGIYGEVHVRTYKADPRTELISIWSRSAERAESIGKKYDCNYTNDLDEIANDERIKIVSIATPDFAHTEAAVKMLEAGKHVLLEKPMAMSVEECQQILDAYNKRKADSDPGLKLMVNFHNRWYPPLIEAKRLIDNGDIGDVVSISAILSDRIEVATQWLSWADKSGPEWFLFPHIVDLVRWLISNQQVKSVFALGKKGVLQSKGVDCYDAVQAQVEFENTIAVFESNWILPQSWRNIIEFKLKILGSKGKINIDADSEGVEVATDKYQTPFVLDPLTEEDPIKYFIDCVDQDTPPTATAEDGIAVTKIIEAVTESLDENKIIRF